MTEDQDDSTRKSRNVINWTAEDRKLLIVTVAATVIANAITVVIVALAVIAARFFRPSHGAIRVDYVFLWGLSIVPIVAVYRSFVYWRDSYSKKQTDLFQRIINWILIPFVLLEVTFLLIYTLAAIGVAVGLN